MSAAREPLGKHVTPRLTDERLSRQWGAIESKVAPRSPWRFGLPVGAGLAVAMAALVWVVAFKRAQPPVMAATLVDGTWLESPAAGPPAAVTLADGSRVALGASSRVRLTSTRADAVRLDVDHGRVDVQATHRTGRSFVVMARDVEVHVVGTRFSVEADGAVRVRVDEGRVQVHDGTGDRFVSGGEEWVQDAPPAVVEPALPSDDEGEEDAGDEGAIRHSPRAARSDAKALLNDAQHAIAQGRTSEAARLFDVLRREHRSDARAALSAFELGRLRLDSLGDPGGAEEAFRDAMRLARDAGLRDDAEARRVEALDKMGAHGRCARARSAYLANHPNGVHRAEVTGWCAGP
jgi:hypothetical protein